MEREECSDDTNSRNIGSVPSTPPVRIDPIPQNLKGRLLLSGGGLYDPNFRHAVVLIAEHGPDGAVGVVLSRPLEVTVEEGIPLLAGLVEPGACLFEGGPVEPQRAVLLVEVDRPDVLDVPVFGSVGFLTGDVSADVRPHVSRARVFLGHAGWGPGQLDAEIAGETAWIVEPARVEDVFSTFPEDLWRAILQRKGGRYATIARIPFDPSAN